MSQFRNYFSVSLIFHVVVLAVLILSFDFSGEMPVLQNSDKDMKVINAVVLDAPPGTDLPKKIPQPKKIVEPVPTPVPPPPKPIEPKKMAVVETPKPKPKPKTIAIADPRKQKILMEKQLLADMQKEAEKQKKVKHKAIEHAFEKEMKEANAKALAEQLLQEENQLAHTAQSQKARGQIDKYKALILQAIGRYWMLPMNINKNLAVKLLIRLGTNGVVFDVQIVQGSGDPAFDRSARAAVYKASPLPVPSDPHEFEPFKQFVLRFKPEEILKADTGLSG